MQKKYINPDTLFPSLQHGFSQVIVVQGGHTVYISGQTAWDEKKQLIGEKDLDAQSKQAFENVKTAIEAAGGQMLDIVSLRIYIVNYQPEDAAIIGNVLRMSFPEDKCPTSTWIGVSSLAVPEFLIEIEAIAVISNKQTG